MHPRLSTYAAQLIEYKEDGKPVCDFLVAVLCNDLEAALALSEDDFKLHDLRVIVEFVSINIPHKMRGSKEAIHAHFKATNAFFQSSSNIESNKGNESGVSS